MRFYDREKELSSLKNIEKRSNTQAQMTLLIGRRRVGKTALVKKAYEKRVYFFVSKKSEVGV